MFHEGNTEPSRNWAEIESETEFGAEFETEFETESHYVNASVTIVTLPA